MAEYIHKEQDIHIVWYRHHRAQTLLVPHHPAKEPFLLRGFWSSISCLLGTLADIGVVQGLDPTAELYNPDKHNVSYYTYIYKRV